jgi:hypothetical protein
MVGLEVGTPCHMSMMQKRGIRMGNATRGPLVPCWGRGVWRRGALSRLASCQGADHIRIQGSARFYGRAARSTLYACPTYTRHAFTVCSTRHSVPTSYPFLLCPVCDAVQVRRHFLTHLIGACASSPRHRYHPRFPHIWALRTRHLRSYLHTTASLST